MYNIVSGQIQEGRLYIVYGTQSIIYNGVTYTTGEVFRGMPGVRVFDISGSGSLLVYEVTELKGANVWYQPNAPDLPVFNELLVIKGSAVEFLQTSEDIRFGDSSLLTGSAIELIDSPSYSFMITENRL